MHGMYQREETRVMTIDLSELAEDGDTLDIGNGRTLRLRIEPDAGIDPFDMFDCYGRVDHVDNGRTNDYGYRTRPAGFDGNAEQITAGRETYWWQPPADVKRTDEGFSQLRSGVRDLLEYGMLSVGVELLEGVDAYGRPIVVNAAWIGGIEPMADADYVAELVREQVAELDID